SRSAEFPAGKLRHRPIKNNPAVFPGNADHQWIIDQLGFFRSPSRHNGHRVGEANPDLSLIYHLPSGAPATHPVIGICQGDTSDSGFGSQFRRTAHGKLRIQIAGAELTVPALKESGFGKYEWALIRKHSAFADVS